MKLKSYKYILIPLQALITVMGFVFANMFHVYELQVPVAVLVTLNLLESVILFLMIFSMRRGYEVDGEILSHFMMLVFATTIYLFLDEMAWLVNYRANLRFWNIFTNTGFYMGTVILPWLYWHFINGWTNYKSSSLNRYITGMMGIALILILGNLRYGYYFVVLEDGTYQRAATFPVAMIAPILIMVLITIALFRRKISWHERLILLMFPVTPFVVNVVTVYAKGPVLTGTATFITILAIYTNLYTRKEREAVSHQVLLRQQELYLAQQEKELETSKIEVTRLQMNPHFIYNTIGSAAELCNIDPVEAEKLLIRFSKYLRSSFGEMSDRTMIPFKKEMEHLDNYLAIEKVRFPDMKVETQFLVTDFELPGLSLQPIVENAIRHGIRGKRSGGNIRITSDQTEEEYILIVEDDGIGYRGIPDDGKKHVGIANVRYRLEKLCDGSLEIKGEKGRGTKVTIRIPKVEV